MGFLENGRPLIFAPPPTPNPESHVFTGEANEVNAASNSANSAFRFGTRTGIADGCRWVYLDVGSNIGVQVRKLYEPHLYENPKAPFDRYFGKQRVSLQFRKHMCVFGFEVVSDS